MIAPDDDVSIEISPPLRNEGLNDLFVASWPSHTQTDFTPILAASAVWVAAFAEHALVGFVNVITDGGKHAFILDTTVHPKNQRRGLGIRLVNTAAELAQQRGAEWLHVDYEPELATFYRRCGFTATQAGLRKL